MVDGKGTLKLTLFSLSRILTDMPRSNAPNLNLLAEGVETVRYFSPETLNAAARPSTGADMWAFGCVVFWVSLLVNVSELFF